MEKQPDEIELAAPRAAGELSKGSELPVVARLVVEIRSDGTRTIARGALEDRTTGAQVALHAEGTTPAALTASLMRSLLSLPLFATVTSRSQALRQAAKALLPGRFGGKRD